MRSIFLVTVFFSSFLLFLCQPMMAKALLPLVGGSPAIWISCMMFFQILLLAGYAYAAIGSAYLTPKRQIFTHLIFMGVTLTISLPIILPSALVQGAQTPELSVLSVLLITIGLPYFLLSSNSSLMQRWFHEQFQTSPYHLFAASNIGSLSGLFGYPLVMEWILPLEQQMVAWGGGFAILTILFMCIAYTMHRTNIQDNLMSMGQNLRIREIVKIVFLGFVPSSLFLSTTLYVSTDLVSFPLLWIIPLALYLISFILVFSKNGEFWIVFAQNRHILAVMAILTASMFIAQSWIWILHFLFFFILALSCHGQAARLKPEPQKLTAYFFWLSVGGACGGIFNSAAPYIFNDVQEYWIVVVLSLFAIPRSQFKFTRLHQLLREKPYVFAAASIACIAFVWLGINKLMHDHQAIYTTRNFFGVSKIQENETSIQLIHGTTFHGVQSKDPSQKLRLTTYYGVINTLISSFSNEYYSKPFGIIGLGAGTQACYGRQGQALEFFEIDQAVIDIAKNSNFFTYIRDCPPNVSIFKGDGRIEIQKRPNHYYNLLVIDAFSSDAVPIHLLTSEAASLYIEKIVPKQGIIAYHITNRHLSFKEVLARVAIAQNMDAYLLEHAGNAGDLFDSPSHWLIMAPKDTPWKQHLIEAKFQPITPNKNTPLWTDQYSNILPTLKW